MPGVSQPRPATDPARIRVIARGVDPAIFDPDGVTAERVIRLSGAWRVPDGQPTIMLPGRLTRWKGQGVAIDALARMRNRDALLGLVGAHQGRAAYLRELMARAESLGVGPRVHIVGDCDDMPAALMLPDVAGNASTG